MEGQCKHRRKRLPEDHDVFTSATVRIRKVNLVLLIVIVSFAEVTYGWSSLTTTARSAAGSASVIGGSLKSQRESLTRLSATLVTERGSASISPDDDDDEDEDIQEPKVTPASSFSRNNAVSKKRKRSHSNPAMGDTGFLRKRTADLLALASAGDPSAASLSSRGMKVERKTFHFLLDAWAFSGEVDAADQALQLLECMEEVGPVVPSIKADVRSYTKVINAISRSASSTAGDDAERILHKMETLFMNGHFSVKPNTHTYTAIMEAHSNSCQPGSAERAEELCDFLVQKYQAGDRDLKPTARAFNAVIHAYGKAGKAAKAEAVFERMEALYESGIVEAKPRTFNYNALISAWANCGEDGSAHTAEEVLERMEYLRKSGNDDIKPTTVSFNAVIDAFAKSGDEGAAERADEILLHMGELYESGENIDAKPNTRSFNSVINAWAKSRSEDSALRAEGLLDDMSRIYAKGNREVRPDSHSFCSVINGKSVGSIALRSHTSI